MCLALFLIVLFLLFVFAPTQRLTEYSNYTRRELVWFRTISFLVYLVDFAGVYFFIKHRGCVSELVFVVCLFFYCAVNVVFLTCSLFWISRKKS